MAEFKMPSLGADMEAGTLVSWRVKPGDRVERGQIVAEVETDKGLIEVEIWQGGIVEALDVEPGRKVPVGTVLARLRGEGEAAPPAPGPAPKPPARPISPAEAIAPAPPPLPTPAKPAAPARAAPPAHRRRVSPAARKLAADRGIDPELLEGTGPAGSVTREDVEKALAKKPPAAAVPDRMEAMRRAMATSMARSKREIPHYYLGAEIELSRTLSWLETENHRRTLADRLLPATLLLKAVAKAAREAPEMNGFFTDGAFHPSSAVHLGVAIALRGGGLIAPAIHDADGRSLDELMRALADLIARVRAGRLRGSELADPTITVTSLGDLGVSTVYGVIHPPQVALVGLGRVGLRPFCLEGGVVSRPGVVATLAADHRVSDGHRGARFLAAIDRLLQTPEAL